MTKSEDKIFIGKDISKLEEIIKIKYKNKNLLRQAMVHRSYLNEHPSFRTSHNERLEFLGDAVLEIVVTEYLFYNFPDRDEGQLTNWRASLVNSKMLATVANEIGLEEFLYLSKGESKDKKSKARQYILANTVEALIGSLYLDQGMRPTKKIIKKYILSKLDYILKHELYLDPKSKFQEKAQEKTGITPHYKVLNESGPDHIKVFEVGLFLGKEQISQGRGSSKQEAQVDAAIEGLKKNKW